jgi:hypothetical protein
LSVSLCVFRAPLNSISFSKIENAFEGLNKRIRGGGVKQALLWYYIKHICQEF